MNQRTAKLSDPSDTVDTPATSTRVQPTTRIRLWDLPIRIFHWSLAVLVLVAFVTANVGGPWMEWHGWSGIAIAGLLAFRLVWGLVGSTHARFWSFIPTPRKVRDYLTGRWQGLGHNPLGALSVFGVLALLAVQVVTGLYGNDDIDFNGPLSGLIEKERSDSLTGLHHQLSDILLILVGLHIAAVLFYVLFKKNNLIKPMLTGWKDVPSAQPQAAADTHRSGSIIGLVAALVVALGAIFVASGEPFRDPVPPPAPAPAASTSTTTAAPPPAVPLSSPAW